MTKKLEELLNLPESQDIVKEEQAKSQAEEKKAENKTKSIEQQKTPCETLLNLIKLRRHYQK